MLLDEQIPMFIIMEGLLTRELKRSYNSERDFLKKENKQFS